MTAPLLSVKGVTKRFRGLVAVDDVSFDVTAGQIFAVIGPNGAGKTTLFNVIAGVYAPSAGTIEFEGQRIDGRTPEQVCTRGIARTFQIVRPFPGLTTLENATIGALLRDSDPDAARDHAGEILRRLDLWEKRDAKAGAQTLPDRKRLEVARALATRPKLLLLDEVMAGLRPTETDRLVAIFRDLARETGVTILLIEHVMRAVMALAERILVLHHGAALMEGEPAAVVRDKRVLDSYLGAEALG
jgi:branched-chain amino acid transport system ATP-binding protein